MFDKISLFKTGALAAVLAFAGLIPAHAASALSNDSTWIGELNAAYGTHFTATAAPQNSPATQDAAQNSARPANKAGPTSNAT